MVELPLHILMGFSVVLPVLCSETSDGNEIDLNQGFFDLIFESITSILYLKFLDLRASAST